MINYSELKYELNIEKSKAKIKSKYYGVRPDTRKNKTWFRSEIMINRVGIYLGLYEDEKSAAFAYNIASDIFNIDKYYIRNNVYLAHVDYKDIQNNVLRLLSNKGYIKFNKEFKQKLK